ncbi:MAG: 1,6-anhydro-N-acetylmuramyl-L-alanine amidase AmpD [Kistimonas sp.]|nr:1,6-anhydro-N-acetylmuramyl-L-alanine amidase AmpD [Kistimonas sp.]
MHNPFLPITEGLLAGAVFCPSPNYNDRPPQASVELLVIHGISLPAGHFGGPFIHQLFTNCLNTNAHHSFCQLQDVQVSAHVLIERDGTLTQFVPFHKRAWHAGVSHWQGRPGCNDFSIGIELEGTDDLPYEPVQYRQLIRVTCALMAAFPALNPDTVVGHCDVAPGRKTDPGKAFDWANFRQALLHSTEHKERPC